jgi:hypothetical protein
MMIFIDAAPTQGRNYYEPEAPTLILQKCSAVQYSNLIHFDAAPAKAVKMMRLQRRLRNTAIFSSHGNKLFKTKLHYPKNP